MSGVRLVMVDNYDSFTYNLVQLIREIATTAQVDVFRNDEIPLLRGKMASGGTCVSLCRNNTCYPTVFSAEELMSLRASLQKR